MIFKTPYEKLEDLGFKLVESNHSSASFKRLSNKNGEPLKFKEWTLSHDPKNLKEDTIIIFRIMNTVYLHGDFDALTEEEIKLFLKVMKMKEV